MTDVQSSPAFYVLSGGPCSGKTTLASALAARGHRVVPEVAADLILRDSGRLWRADPLAFQQAVLRTQLERESDVLTRQNGGVVFLDRGIGDHFGFLEFHSLPVFPELETAWEDARRRYQAVFLLAQNPDYSTTPYRAETQEQAIGKHRSILSGYRSRHPRVVEIPWSPLDARLASVLAEVDGAKPA